MASSRIVRVGIIGCGEVTQVVHIPTLGFLSDLFLVTYLCDVSQDALNHCSRKVIGGVPKLTIDPQELCASVDVDVVLIANSDQYHALHTCSALEHQKHVFVEKPMALNLRDADAIAEAEGRSKGTVMVGYMRRYAPAFVDAVKEIGGLDKIAYARVRDIIGPNALFVSQSATFPKKFTDFSAEATADMSARADELVFQGLATENGVEVTPNSTRMWRMLGGLGSHDLSVMRETLGMPTAVLGASMTMPFWNVLFQYPGFACSYESGIDNIPRFDAHIEVHAMSKMVSVKYDTPYVKGLPTTMTIKEQGPEGEYRETLIRKTYEDSYTVELKLLWGVVVEGTKVKTTPADARKDLEIFGMIMRATV